MARRVFLPLTSQLEAALREPSATAMRERLGGRLGGAPRTTHVRVGTVVRVATGSASEQVGVVLCAEAGTVDVFLERGHVKRTQPNQVQVHVGEPTPEQARVSREVRVFETLHEGQQVLVEGDDGERTGATLREKCRYGALVETAEGRLLAVGFRRLWPLATEQTPC